MSAYGPGTQAGAGREAAKSSKLDCVSQRKSVAVAVAVLTFIS